jgi:peptidoglycan/xylan/chitin deacetylase (PgdA/CDA1 family)
LRSPRLPDSDMWTRLLAGIGSAAGGRWVAGSGRGRLVVLCYHDLCERDDFTSWLRVEVARFREHLEALAAYGRFVAPDALENLDELPADRLHFLITFDDGYLNNLRLAADVLEQNDVPALFFISTHHLVSGEAFWFDRVVTRIQAAHLSRLDLSHFGLDDYRFFATDGARRWEDIQRLLTDLKHLGNPNEPSVARILGFLDSEYGIAAEVHDQRLRPLTIQELIQLASRRQTSFGSHGHQHEILSRLGQNALAESVSASKQILEGVLNRPIDEIAYPNGDEDQRVIDACIKAGYRRGYGTDPGLVPRKPDLWRIPRLFVGGYDTAADVIANVNTLLVKTATSELMKRGFSGWSPGDTSHGSHQPR